jgi:DNA uptake protein ComE-like DNA-binding protein
MSLNIFFISLFAKVDLNRAMEQFYTLKGIGHKKALANIEKSIDCKE